MAELMQKSKLWPKAINFFPFVFWFPKEIENKLPSEPNLSILDLFENIACLCFGSQI